MLAVVEAIALQAGSRVANAIAVRGETVSVVASAGLLLNVVVGRMLSHESRDLNVRAALLHVVANLFGSLMALISGGVVVWGIGWFAVGSANSWY